MERKEQVDLTTPEAEPEETQPAPKRRRASVFAFAPFFSLLVAALVLFVLVLALSGRTVPFPEIVRSQVEEQINKQLPGAPLNLGALGLGVSRKGVPKLLLNDLRFADPNGGAVAELNALDAELSVGDLLRGQIAARSVSLAGAQITIRRTSDGQFTLAGDAGLSGEDSAAAVLADIHGAMADGELARLEQVEANGIVLTLEDARSGRIWQASNATATLRASGDVLSVSVTSDVFNGTDEIAGLQLSLTRNRSTGHVFLGALATNMLAADIALQSPILSWLSVLDAPLSGSVRAELDETGALRGFAGTLDIDEGALKPVDAIPVVAFDSAKAYFTFDPTRQRIDFTEVSFGSEAGELIGSGHSYLTEFQGEWPQAFVGQYNIDRVAYAGGSAFDGPVVLEDNVIDMRLRLDPFVVDLGQVAIANDGQPIHASGRIAADAEGWHVAVDATAKRLTSERVLAFWPAHISPVTRDWLETNLKQGTLHDPALGLRYEGEGEPDVSLSFDFANGVAQFLPALPPLEAAVGRAELHGSRFSLLVSEGHIEAPNGTRIAADGSRFTVADVRPKPSMGEIDFRAAGGLQAMLGVLNKPPFRLMERAERPVEIAQAQTVTSAKVRLPLKDGIETEEVSFEVAATLRDVESDQVLPGFRFVADQLNLTATEDNIEIAGAAFLDGVPLTARWRQSLFADDGESGTVTGALTLSQEALSAFNLPLPDQLLTGQGQADYALRLPKDPALPPTIELSSDLQGLGMQLDALGWRKPQNATGRLDVSAILGDVPELQGLSLDAAGLAFDSQVDLSATGALDRILLRDLRLGDWLDADVEVTIGANSNVSQVSVLGGTLDLRQLDLSAGGGGGPNQPISINLDRLIVSDSIAIAPLRGQIEKTARGLSGTFDGQINGTTPIKGTLAPANAGTAIRITSGNAAGVLRDAGLTSNARGGTLNLVLAPVSGASSGTYDGEFTIRNIRLRDAPAMASLLDAVSIVGLLDQLAGPGINFDVVDGRFRLDRRQLRLQRAAAVGPSIGISADGVYSLQSDQMDIQGVVSPVYFLNGIGSILTRRGEGLFGFNYRMAGAAEDPRVRVNPLSILTPGAFREIFRRAPPGG